MDSNYSCSTSGRSIANNFTLTPALEPNSPARDCSWVSGKVCTVFVAVGGRQEPGFESLSRSVLMPNIVWASSALPNNGASQKHRSIPMPLKPVSDESKTRQFNWERTPTAFASMLSVCWRLCAWSYRNAQCLLRMKSWLGSTYECPVIVSQPGEQLLFCTARTFVL